MYTSDSTTAGLVSSQVSALRYDGQSDDPDEVAGVLKSLMPEGVSVLDVGCGTGSVTLIANHAKGNRVVAIEPNVDRYLMARSRGIDAINCFLDEKFISDHEPYDVIMSSDVLEHLTNPAATLDLFKSALKPDGMIIVSVPNVAHWSVRLNLLRGRFRYEDSGIMDATHIRWFTRETLVELFKSRSLAISQIRVTAGFDLRVYTGSLLRWIPGRVRRGAIRLGIRTLPALFATQYVVVARPAT